MKKCKKHPKYKVICKPKTSCRACWLMWWEKHLPKNLDDGYGTYGGGPAPLD
ncbi:unnamed protein product [marine sediment metagenome]|uniref:Uncharacterized protein n=1 Tax=marine sediment metagenome TaxID=412755 RepID=X1BU02_9ZZZZ